ncbi:MAG: hypothetical protein AAB491_00300 [Patescibacteria group bacterium]
MEIRDIFLEMLKSKTNAQFSDQEVDSMINDLFSVAISHIIIAAGSKLNVDETKPLKKLVEEKNFKGAMDFIELKLGKKILGELVEKEITPVIDEYIDEVIYK